MQTFLATVERRLGRPFAHDEVRTGGSARRRVIARLAVPDVRQRLRIDGYAS
jgi:hypothetical protein